MISRSIVRKRRGASEFTIYNRSDFLNRNSRARKQGSAQQDSTMKRLALTFCVVLLFVVSLQAQNKEAQNKRVWVLRAPGEMAEYDAATFAPKQTVKVPAEAVASPQSFSVNHPGQMLFSAPVSLPLAEGDLAAERKVWLWDGHTTTTLEREVARTTSTAGSNLVITESAPVPYLSADGSHLYWFSNQARRLQRDGVDLSTKTTWSSWQTDLAGGGRQEVASSALPDCSCPTGSCEESCPYGEVRVPDEGVGKFFLLTEFVSGKMQPVYKSTFLYQDAGKWTAPPLDPPLRRVLDAPTADTILQAIPDTGCCGWQNQSDDQTLLRVRGKDLIVFDERTSYKNPDYDVSFYTENGKLSPGLGNVALTIAATARPNTPIQLSEQGQASPEESLRIRKALLDLPAVEVMSTEDVPRRIAFLPHAALVGWISEQEILIVEGHLLVAYNVATRTRRKSNVHVEDAGQVFLR